MWTEGSRFYEQLRVVDDINDSRLWAQASKCSEQLKAVDDMNDLGCEIKAIYATNSSRL